MTRTAHVYRHRRWADDIPNPHHAAAVLSPGPWVLVYWDNGWREFGGGYNHAEQAEADGVWLSGRVAA